MTRYSDAELRARRRYDDKAYDKVTVRLPKGTREDIEELMQMENIPSVNQFISRLVLREIKRVKKETR